MENAGFKNKNDWYYNLFKSRIACLIPEGSHIVFDLGCGTGEFGSKLRDLKKAQELVGVEIFKEAADEAAKHYEKVYHGDLEHLELDYEEYFDFVICNDILEHLVDPWRILRKIHVWLKNEGYVVFSIPNIRYWRVLRDVIFLGRWDYVKAGILDNTHLRFFTKKSFLKLLKETGFDVKYVRMEINGTKHNFFNGITCHLFEEFMGTQIIVMAKKNLGVGR